MSTEISDSDARETPELGAKERASRNHSGSVSEPSALLQGVLRVAKCACGSQISSKATRCKPCNAEQARCRREALKATPRFVVSVVEGECGEFLTVATFNASAKAEGWQNKVYGPYKRLHNARAKQAFLIEAMDAYNDGRAAVPRD